MSGTSAPVARGILLPDAIRDAFRAADHARSAGDSRAAAAVLSAALGRVRAEPFGTPFVARVQLALATADAQIDAGDRERARRTLLDEAGFCEQIVQLLAADGTPEQRRSAATGRLQVRDRLAQIELLGTVAPEIAVADWVMGEATSLASLRGKVILLEFWATWCRPCLEMFPRLRDLQERYGPDGLEILALTRYGPSAPGEAGAESQARERRTVETVIADRGLAVRVGMAADGRMQGRYGANGVPTLVLIDRAGLVRTVLSGGDEAALDAEIQRCLAEPAYPLAAADVDASMADAERAGES